jgi:hypothetical protein
MLPYRYHYLREKTHAFFGRRSTIRSAASTAAFAMKLLTLRRSDAAAWSTSIRSSSVRYTKVFRPKGSLDRRRDFGEGPFFMAEIVHRRNGETNDALGYPERPWARYSHLGFWFNGSTGTESTLRSGGPLSCAIFCAVRAAKIGGKDRNQPANLGVLRIMLNELNSCWDWHTGTALVPRGHQASSI